MRHPGQAGELRAKLAGPEERATYMVDGQLRIRHSDTSAWVHRVLNRPPACGSGSHHPTAAAAAPKTVEHFGAGAAAEAVRFSNGVDVARTELPIDVGDSTAHTQGSADEKWQQAVDESSGEYYYYNTETHETSWEMPEGGFTALHDDVSQPEPHAAAAQSQLSDEHSVTRTNSPQQISAAPTVRRAARRVPRAPAQPLNHPAHGWSGSATLKSLRAQPTAARVNTLDCRRNARAAGQ